MKRVFIADDARFRAPAQYTVDLVGHANGIAFEQVRDPRSADLIIDHERPDSVPMAIEFYDRLATGQSIGHPVVFEERPSIETADGREDHLATIFYMVNCLQEQDAAHDEFGRFRYDASYQHRFDCCEDNRVQHHMDRFLEGCGETPERHRSFLFLTHDIDEMYGSFLQDGMWAIRNRRPLVLLSVIVNAMLCRPAWRNIDRIMQLNSEYDLKATFFWLVEKGRSQGIRNADYRIEKERPLLRAVTKGGHYNGLHKSSAPRSIGSELADLPVDTGWNRYHFLRFRTKEAWEEIERSPLTLDASLGFAEHIGFRNSYGRPFRPYNPETGAPFGFVEVPLHIMDRTLHKYMQLRQEDLSSTVINFFERHRENCVLSLLWHNNYFTDYKYGGFLAQYKRIIAYLHEERFEALSPTSIEEKW